MLNRGPSAQETPQKSHIMPLITSRTDHTSSTSSGMSIMSIFDAGAHLQVSTILPLSNAQADNTSSALVLYTGGSSAVCTLDAELIAFESKDYKSSSSNGLVSGTCDNVDSNTSDHVYSTASDNSNINASGNIDTNSPRDLVLRKPATSPPQPFDKVLPGELRNEFYEHLLADIPLDFRVKEDRLRLTEWSANRTDTSKQPYLQRLCLLPFISPLVFVECTSIFLLRSTFFIASLDDIFHLETFLLTVPNVHSFDMVREVFLVDYDTQASTRSRADAILGFCVRFSKLEQLHIHIGAKSLLEPTSYQTVNGVIYCDPEPRLRALSQVVDDLELGKVARMPLKAVTIVVDYKWLWWCVPRTVAMDIGYWLVNTVLEQQAGVRYVNTSHLVDPSRQIAKFGLDLIRE